MADEKMDKQGSPSPDSKTDSSGPIPSCGRSTEPKPERHPEDTPERRLQTATESDAANCSGPPEDEPWIDHLIETPAGSIPVIRTKLIRQDILGRIKARFGIGRMRYRISPGLYAVGAPSPDSPVLVSANYKLSFDSLRCELAGLDAWVLVLDTKGINV